jgi:hypothetical protein
VEPGETPLQAAKRELQVEINFTSFMPSQTCSRKRQEYRHPWYMLENSSSYSKEIQSRSTLTFFVPMNILAI